MTQERTEEKLVTGLLIGYARVSTYDQNLDAQKDDLLRAGVAPELIYEEHVSGAKTKRPQLEECIKACRVGDTLVVCRLDRLGRNLPELINLMDRLKAKNVGFRSLAETIDTTSAMGVMIFHMFGAFAQFERDLISERTKAGLRAARARGAKGGRKPKIGKEQLRMAHKLLADPTTSMQDAANALRVSRATLYRAINREKRDKEIAAMPPNELMDK